MKIKKQSLKILSVWIVFLATTGCHKHHHAAHHSFDNIEKYAKIFENPKRAEWQKPDEIVKRMMITDNAIIGDIGAGTGYFTRRFAGVVKKGEIYGFDVEPKMVEYMKKHDKGKYQAVLIDPEKPLLKKSHFDILFFCDVIHHIEKPVDYLKHIKSSLKPFGRIIIVEFKKEKSPVGPPMSYRIKKTDLINIFKQAGYTLAKQEDFLPYQYYLEFKLLP